MLARLIEQKPMITFARRLERKKNLCRRAGESMRIFDGGPRRPSIYRGCHQSRRGKSREIFASEGDRGRETDGTRRRVRGSADRDDGEMSRKCWGLDLRVKFSPSEMLSNSFAGPNERKPSIPEGIG